MRIEHLIPSDKLHINASNLNDLLERLITEPPMEMSNRTQEAYINDLIDIIGSTNFDSRIDTIAIILSDLNRYGWSVFVKNSDGTVHATNLE